MDPRGRLPVFALLRSCHLGQTQFPSLIFLIHQGVVVEIEYIPQSVLKIVAGHLSVAVYSWFLGVFHLAASAGISLCAES